MLSTAPMCEAVRKIWKVKKRSDWDLCRSLLSFSDMETIGRGRVSRDLDMELGIEIGYAYGIRNRDWIWIWIR